MRQLQKKEAKKKQKTDKLKIKRTELDEQLAVAFALIRRQCENTCYIVIFSWFFLLNVTHSFTWQRTRFTFALTVYVNTVLTKN